MDDETELIGQRHIGTMPRGTRTAVLSETPADYDEVEDVSFDNPVYANEPEYEDMTGYQKSDDDV